VNTLKIRSRSGVADWVSSGTVLKLLNFVNLKGVDIRGPKTQLEIFQENRVMAEMARRAGERLYEILHAPIHQVHNSAESALSYRSQRIDSHREEIESIVDRVLQEFPVGEVTRWPSEFKFEVGKVPLQMESAFLTRPQLSPRIEQVLIERLSRGEELYLTYLHVFSYARKVDGRDGFMDIPRSLSERVTADQVLKSHGELGGVHAAPVVDVIKQNGRITHLVVRSSWGHQAGADSGHFYVSIQYLAEFPYRELTSVEVSHIPSFY
jgi:hypothetical protein